MSDQSERRGTPRVPPQHHGIVSARVRPGHDVRVIDVGGGGALIEGPCRLLPGSSVELQLATTGRRIVMRGRILRCAVAALRATGVCYRGAIGFDGHLRWTTDGGCEYPLPHAETHHARDLGADASHVVLG
jgi:hypothetical protein